MTVTSGKEWRKEVEPVEIELPSGKIVAIRPVSAELIFKLGRIPDSLTPLVVDAINGGGEFVLDTKDPKQLRAFLEMADCVAETAFVNPRIVKEPVADDEIPIEAVTLEDRTFLMRFFGRPASALREFRDEQASHVEPVDTGAKHKPATQRTTEPEPVGG